MVEQCRDGVFTAGANHARGGMLATLMEAERSVRELAVPYAMSLAGAAKDVAILADAGLIARHRKGRQQMCRLRPERLKEASDWLRQWEGFWNARLDALERALREGP